MVRSRYSLVGYRMLLGTLVQKKGQFFHFGSMANNHVSPQGPKRIVSNHEFVFPLGGVRYLKEPQLVGLGKEYLRAPYPLEFDVRSGQRRMVIKHVANQCADPVGFVDLDNLIYQSFKREPFSVVPNVGCN